jgi:hypothetical protein
VPDGKDVSGGPCYQEETNEDRKLYVCCSLECVTQRDSYCYLQLRSVSGQLIQLIDIATGYGLDDRRVGVRVPVESRIFSSPNRLGRLWGLPSILRNEYKGLFPRGVKWPGPEADHSSPTNAEIKKMWIHSSICLHAVMLN